MEIGKHYIGDSVYYQFDGFGIVLTTENGFGPSNEIYMEPEVLYRLIDRAVEDLKIKIEPKHDAEFNTPK